MTTQPPLTSAQVFSGSAFRTNEGREGSRFFFPGHLDAQALADIYFQVFPEHRTEYPYTIEAESISHTWHLFTEHEDSCHLVAAADPEDPFTPEDYDLCTCEAQQGLEEGPGYEYRHPHQASATTPGSIAVTWVDITPA